MSRSLYKGPYVDEKLMKKIAGKKPGESGVIKTWARASMISPEMVGFTFGVHNGKKFIAQGLQTAAGVPLQCDEPADYRSFRIGLFGLDKLHNVDRTVAQLAAALEKVA